MGLVQNSARRQRGLMVAGGAFPGFARRQGPSCSAMTPGTSEAIWSSTDEEIVQARPQVDKAGLELQNRMRKIRCSHGHRRYLS